MLQKGGLFASFALLSLIFGAKADVYMHNPRGSNNRNCERNANRNNGARLFDSQNNAAGGYACPRAVNPAETEKVYFYAGSVLPIEWTAQHGCGTNPRVKCEMIIQYACEETLDPEEQFRGGSRSSSEQEGFERPDPRYIGTPRDGMPEDANDAATDRIPDDRDSAIAATRATRRFGMHENYYYYKDCKERSRNRGLFTADQNVRRNDARGTRQNPNGDRRGFECPEERDYYPYWHPSPWMDIAVLHSYGDEDGDAQAQAFCDFYKANSQNNLQNATTSGICIPEFENDEEVVTLRNEGRWYNNRGDCEENGHTWENRPFGLQNPEEHFRRLNWTIPEVDCQLAPYQRSNHLGNAQDSVYQRSEDRSAIPHNTNAVRYVWRVPDTPSKNCVMRLRYNMSSLDYETWRKDPDTPSGVLPEVGTDASSNAGRVSDEDDIPIVQDPYVQIGSERQILSLAVNTNQYGRTFQDRSFVFEIRRPQAASDGPSEDSEEIREQDEWVHNEMHNNGRKLYNLNVRGKRGNIVQVFPSVEYDFIPNDLQVHENDLVHWQWTGSDYNPRRGCNNAEGGPPDPNSVEAANQNSRADRSNVVEMPEMEMNEPQEMDVRDASSLTNRTMFVDENGNPDIDTILRLAYLNQEEQLGSRRCMTEEELNEIRNNNVRENHPLNCAKLNAAFTPYFDGRVVQMRRQGSYAYFSSRNNNLSNRNQKGRLCVGSTTFCEARTRPNREDEVSGARFHQIDQDRIDQTEDILQGETDPFMPWDNDILGDGDAAETEDGCQALRLEERSGSSSGMSSGSIAGVVIGVLLISLVVTLLVQYGVGAWRDRQAGAPIRSPYAHFCGSSSRRKPVQGSQPPAQHRHQRLDDSESSGDEAPRAPRKPIISWQTGNMSAQQQYSRGAAPQSRLPPTPETEMVEQGQAGKGSSAQRPAVQGVRPPPPPPGGQ